ncbi:MAG: NBR1-Ig-like domain-containing protein [Anaerolineales bacterium]
MVKSQVYVLILLSMLLVLTACQGRESEPTEDIYRPPTPVSSPAPLLQPTVKEDTPVVEFSPTGTPTCVHNLRFISDLSIPDGTIVSPGEKLDKRWQVENNGTCNWDQEYRVRLVAGPAMGVPTEQALYPALSGTQAIIRMIFTAPETAGTYRSAWQAYSPQGNPFGDPFFIEVVVSEGASSP